MRGDIIVQYLAAVPPDMLGMPTWALNGLSVGSLVLFIVMGLGTSRLYTRRQVNEQTKQHEREVSTLTTQHEREVADLKARYETHITRTVELYQGRVNDALAREQERRGEAKEWQGIARQWETTAQMLAQGLEPLQEQSETMLRIVSAWQSEVARRRELGSAS